MINTIVVFPLSAGKLLKSWHELVIVHHSWSGVHSWTCNCAPLIPGETTGTVMPEVEKKPFLPSPTRLSCNHYCNSVMSSLRFLPATLLHCEKPNQKRFLSNLTSFEIKMFSIFLYRTIFNVSGCWPIYNFRQPTLWTPCRSNAKSTKWQTRSSYFGKSNDKTDGQFTGIKPVTKQIQLTLWVWPSLLGNQFSKIPEVSKSSHHIWNLLYAIIFRAKSLKFILLLTSHKQPLDR